MQKVKLGEVATYINGYAFKPSDWSEKGIPIIRIQDLTGSDYQTNYYDGEIDSRYIVNNGDLLISWSATLGVYIWNQGKAFLNQHIFKVLLNEQITDKLYFYYQVESILKRAQNEAHGATMKHLTRKVFDNLPYNLPPIEEQKAITEKLDKVSILIEKRKQQLSLLDTLVKSKFVEMFGDLKNNSKQWRIYKFSDFAIIDGNMTTNYKKYAKFPHIGIDSIEKETGEIRGFRTVEEDGVISGKYLFNREHIIYSKIRPNLNKVALPNFEGLCSADAYPILPRKGICNRFYLAYVMRSRFFLEYILQFSGRTNMPKVNREAIYSFKMPLPSFELQEKFADFVKQTEKTKAKIKQSLAALELLKKSLMQKYFG